MSDQTNQSEKTFEQKKIDTYRRHGLRNNIVPIMRRRFGFDDPQFAGGGYMETLLHHMRFIRGETWIDLCGNPADLSQSMTDFFRSDDPEEHQQLQAILWHLRDKNLVYKRYGHRGRVYWDVTKYVWELIEDKVPFDGGEGPEHRRAVGLINTYFGALKGCDVELYAALSNGGKVDAVVTHTVPDSAPDSIEELPGYGAVRDEVLEYRLDQVHAQARKNARVESWPPGERPIAVEVMSEHNNTQLVLNRYDQIAESGFDGLWVFSNRPAMNMWIRRLANPQADGEDPRFDSPYMWSPTTPIDVAQSRVEEMDLEGMRWVTTVDQLENRIGAVKNRNLKLQRAYALDEVAMESVRSAADVGGVPESGSVESESEPESVESGGSDDISGIEWAE